MASVNSIFLNLVKLIFQPQVVVFMNPKEENLDTHFLGFKVVFINFKQLNIFLI